MTSQQTDAEQDAMSGAGGVLRQLLARRQAETKRGRPPELPRQTPSTPSRAAATAFGRVAERLHALPVQPLDVSAGALTLAELVEVLPDRPLLGVLQGPGDALGAVALCPEAVTALIEIQTLGRVTTREGERRRPTRSEALLCTDFINALLTELREELAGLPGFESMGAFRFVTAVDEARSLSLLLDHDAFRSLDFQMRLGAPASRDGRLLLALPQAEAQTRPLPAGAPATIPQLEAPSEAPAPGAPAPEDIASAVREASVEVVGVLCRRRITLGELRALTEGRLLMLPRARLTDARVETVDGQLLAQGRFGEAAGCHAIRLGAPAEEAASRHAGGAMLDGIGAPAAAFAPSLLPEADDPFRLQMEDGAGLGGGLDLPEGRIAS